ncbi:MAG: PAS domain S-box protein, partial [Pseudomonadota bacterium]
MFSLKTKYAAFGAAIALVLAVAFTAVFVVVMKPTSLGLGAGPLPLLVMFFAALTISGSAWLAFVYGRRLVSSLNVLSHSAARITQGDYTQPVDTVRRDELGDLQRTVEQMRQRLRQTTINKNYLHSVLNSMSDAVFVTASDGTIKIANSAACRLSGVVEEDLVGKPIASLLESGDRDPEEALKLAREVGETVLRTLTGQTIPVSFSGAGIETEDPQFAGCIFVARDITDRKRAERRIRYLARYDA